MRKGYKTPTSLKGYGRSEYLENQGTLGSHNLFQLDYIFML